MEPIEGDDELQRVISDIIPNYKFFKPASEQETRNELIDPFDNGTSDFSNEKITSPSTPVIRFYRQHILTWSP
jgi:hypothetical protein